MNMIETALPDAVVKASEAFRRPLQFSVGLMDALKNDTASIDSLRHALWAYSGEAGRMSFNWALVSYLIHDAPVAVMLMDVATRAELGDGDYRLIGDDMSFLPTMQDGREDKIIVYVKRVKRDRKTMN